ncbi:RDD family protein [Halioxenophilus aromaticivorans]|uniref:RDD family protein n=1 Tax=Halioxenophilus aromaticivorans TaxID=1306992 RepID=A0AAV3U348_9ALTE
MIDTRYQIETPEGIDLQAQLAGPAPRGLAFLTDFSIRAVIYIAGSIVFGIFGWGYGFILVLLFLLEWFYPVLFEVLNKGQTPGKQLMDLAVVNDDLTPITWHASVIRNLLRTADMLPFFYLFGISALFITARFQRLGDLAAGTLVIHKILPTDSHSLPEVPAQAPAHALALDDQIAIINYTQRHHQLSESRQQELAEILTPLHNRKGLAAVRYLQGMGRWLLGDKS